MKVAIKTNHTGMESVIIFFICFQHTLKSTYELLVLELKKVQEVYNLGKGGTDFSWERKLAELLVHVIEYVSAKKELLDLYPMLIS